MPFVFANLRGGILQLLQAFYGRRPTVHFIAGAIATGQRGENQQSAVLATG